MEDSKIILSLLRDRFDGIERRMERHRAAIETAADVQNRTMIALIEVKNDIAGIKEAFADSERERAQAARDRRHVMERLEDNSHQRKGRLAVIASGLIGGLAGTGFSLLSGLH